MRAAPTGVAGDAAGDAPCSFAAFSRRFCAKSASFDKGLPPLPLVSGGGVAAGVGPVGVGRELGCADADVEPDAEADAGDRFSR